jgi:hypothetical protein
MLGRGDGSGFRTEGADRRDRGGESTGEGIQHN